MFRITQGPATEFQIFVFYGIVMFVMLAPVLIGTAALLGYLTRPIPVNANADATHTDVPMPVGQLKTVEHYHFAKPSAPDHGRLEMCMRGSEPVRHETGGVA